jgi:hypothetical protein
VFADLFRPHDSDRPAALREKGDADLGTGGTGMSFKGMSRDLHSSPLGTSVDDGAVEVALNREELSVVDAVLVLEAPLPLGTVSIRLTKL